MAQSTTSTPSHTPDAEARSASAPANPAPSARTVPASTLEDLKAAASEMAAEAANLCTQILTHVKEADGELYATLKGLTSDIHEALHLLPAPEPAEAPPVHQPS